MLGADPPLKALLAAARDRYLRSGSWTGKSIALSTDELRSAAAALGLTSAKVRLPMKTLDRALQRTRFKCSVEEAVRWAFDVVPPTRQEADAASARRWEELQAEMLSLAGPAAAEVGSWLTRRAANLRREWTLAELLEAGRVAVRIAGASRELTEPEVVPVLANRVAGDPHALDVGRAARRYFERILMERHADLAMRPPLRANERAALLAASNLAADGISSQVWAVGLVSTDRMLSEARQSWHTLGLPLITVSAINDISSHGNAAFAVENRSVFGALVPAIADLPPAIRPTLICTSGNPSLAARVLLRKLASCGVTIYYGGDTDTRGLQITRMLESALGAALRRWRMSVPPGQVRYQETSLTEMITDLRTFSVHGALPNEAN